MVMRPLSSRLFSSKKISFLYKWLGHTALSIVSVYKKEPQNQPALKYELSGTQMEEHLFIALNKTKKKHKQNSDKRLHKSNFIRFFFHSVMADVLINKIDKKKGKRSYEQKEKQ